MVHRIKDALEFESEGIAIQVRPEVPDLLTDLRAPSQRFGPFCLRLQNGVTHRTWLLVKLDGRCDVNASPWQLLQVRPGEVVFEQRAEPPFASGLLERGPYGGVLEVPLGRFKDGDLKLIFRPEMREQPRLRKLKLFGQRSHRDLAKPRDASGAQGKLHDSVSRFGTFVHEVFKLARPFVPGKAFRRAVSLTRCAMLRR